MRSKPNDGLWMGAAFAGASVVAAVMLTARGIDVKGTDAALAATARLSFLLFWLAYSGGAMASLFGPRFQPLRARGRQFGLAFAAAHLVHMGLVAWLCVIGAAPDLDVFVFFGVALVWIYLLALFSLGGLQKKLHPMVWGFLRTIGMNTILYAFATDFFNNPLHGGAKHMAEYSTFAALCVIAPILRLAAFLWRMILSPRMSEILPRA